MKTLSITAIARRHTVLREALEKHGTVEIVWKEAKPNGEVVFSAIVTKKEIQNANT